MTVLIARVADCEQLGQPGADGGVAFDLFGDAGESTTAGRGPAAKAVRVSPTSLITMALRTRTKSLLV